MRTLTLMLFVTLVFSNMRAQDTGGSLGLAFGALSTKSVEFERNYVSGNNDLSSRRSLGFEGRLTYIKPIGNDLSITANCLAGFWSYYLSIKLTEDFVDLGWEGIDDYYYEWGDIQYLGLSTGLLYRPLCLGAFSASVGVNISAVYFLPLYLESFSSVAILEDGTRKLLFQTSVEFNPNDAILFQPEIYLQFDYNLTERVAVSFWSLGAFSKTMIMKTDGDYELVGDSNTLEGSFRKYAGFFGAYLGFRYNL